MSPVIRVGYIGCGAVVQKSHLPAIHSVKGFSAEALIDLNHEQTTTLSEAYSVPVTSDCIDNVIDCFDLGVVATPAGSHFEIGRKLLKAGKHVLMEKPLAVNIKQAEELLEIARDGDRLLAVSLVRRYLPHFRLFKNLVEMNVVGQIESFVVEEGYQFNWPVQSIDFYSPSKSGGGVLLDNGAHLLDAVLWWFGNAKLISYSDDASGGIEADCRLNLELDNGAKGQVVMSRLRGLSNKIDIFGSKGKLTMDFATGQISILGKKNGEVLAGFSCNESGRRNELTTLELFACQYNQIRSYINAENGYELVVGEDCLKSIHLIQQCYESNSLENRGNS